MLVQKRNASEIGVSERHQIIQEFLSSNKSKVEIWRKYTGQAEEHGQILRWMRKYGYSDEPKKIIFAPVMSKNETISDDNLDTHLNYQSTPTKAAFVDLFTCEYWVSGLYLPIAKVRKVNTSLL